MTKIVTTSIPVRILTLTMRRTKTISLSCKENTQKTTAVREEAAALPDVPAKTGIGTIAAHPERRIERKPVQPAAAKTTKIRRTHTSIIAKTENMYRTTIQNRLHADLAVEQRHPMNMMTSTRRMPIMRTTLETPETAPAVEGGIPWILQAVLYSALGLGLGLFARYIDLHPSDSTIQSLAVSLSDLPFWMMCAVGISVYSKNGLAAFANVLLFFSFMDIAYYWYSYQYDGTLLMKLFVFWGLLGAASSLLAPFVHYAKSKGVFGFVLSVLILAVQAILTGWSVIGWNFLWFVGSMLFLSRKSIFMTLLMGLAGGLLGIGVWMYLHQIGVSSLLRHSTRTGEESAFMVWIKQTDLSVWLEQLLYRLGMVPGQ
ncbi:hypothetical protein [Allobaculum sp. Allo2]|uniref:hypothetical protein n=1 Tax=Allobaculum sp. Allo2 TaxID=2853432 RepID=UPI001F607BC6|nr:hypothetical protein [Allobaculum sp. Allo2]UNT92753.1 hypothetical protein KWG61_11700 [Allobaculum sp. Allo2]